MQFKGTRVVSGALIWGCIFSAVHWGPGFADWIGSPIKGGTIGVADLIDSRVILTVGIGIVILILLVSFASELQKKYNLLGGKFPRELDAALRDDIGSIALGYGILVLLYSIFVGPETYFGFAVIALLLGATL